MEKKMGPSGIKETSHHMGDLNLGILDFYWGRSSFKFKGNGGR